MKTLVTLVALLALLSQQATAQPRCEISGATISFEITSCHRQTGRCVQGPQKIVILGKKIFYYHDLIENTGLQFQLDETIDLLKDPAHKSRIYSSTRIPGTYFRSLGMASYIGNDLRIMKTRDLHIEKSGFQYGKNYPKDFQLGKGVHSLVIRISPDCRTCAVIQDVSSDQKYDGTMINQIDMTGQTCTFQSGPR